LITICPSRLFPNFILLFFVWFADCRNDDIHDISGCGCCNSNCLRTSNTVHNLSNPDPDESFPEPTLTLAERRRQDKLCCCCPSPFPRSQSYALDAIPLTPFNKTENSEPNYFKSGTQTLSRKKHRRHPLIPSKTVISPPTTSPSLLALLSTQEQKAISIACLQDAKLIFRDKLLATFPNKLASTGVRIFYMCDPIPTTNDESKPNGNWILLASCLAFLLLCARKSLLNL
jgi:hypothetical protein